MKTKASITVKNKIYPYTLEKVSPGIVKFVCKAANINQEFLSEDIAELFIDLPNLILSGQEYNGKQSDTIRFRVSSEDKMKIEKKAIKSGYGSVSKYLRDLALG